MATRSCVGYFIENKWKGVYCHFDGYPPITGKNVWKMIKQLGNENFIKFIEEHPGGFSSFPELCYCHNRKNPREMIITSDFPDPLFIEWLYLLNSKENKLYIYASATVAPIEEEGEATKKIPELDAWLYPNICVAKHFLVSVVDLNNEEPNWDEIEEMAIQKRKEEQIKLKEQLKKTGGEYA